MQPLIPVVHLFPILDEKLIALLRSLSPEDWQRPTLAKQWCVKDVAAHLLDGNVRAIAGRDNYEGPLPATPINSYQDLVGYLNELNASFVKAMQRMSPQLLTDLLESTGKQYSEIMASQPLFTKARFSVAWAGEEESMNWFHIAREYTEKWHHQQQIRHAVGKEDKLMTQELFYPLIDTLLCGLPHAMRNTQATENTAVQVTIASATGGDWFVIRNADKWILSKENTLPLAAHIKIEPKIAWKLFTKALKPSLSMAGVQVQGDEQLCKAVLEMVAVMA
jgi:uncharacterized protein (TIGR03083 family)